MDYVEFAVTSGDQLATLPIREGQIVFTHTGIYLDTPAGRLGPYGNSQLFNSQITSEEGAHGLRYSTDSGTFEIYNETTEQWDMLSSGNSIAEEYSETAQYAVGTYCAKNGKLYRCATDVPEGGEAWNAEHWKETTVAQELQTSQETADRAMELAQNAAFTISTVPAQLGSLTYTGAAQTPAWSNHNTDQLALGGIVSGTNAGTYTATFTPKEGYHWADGSIDAVSVTWKIGRANVEVPSQGGSLIFKGSSQSPIWNNYDSNKLTIGGTASGTNVGNYSATFTPKDNYQWVDGSTAAKTVSWSIGEAASGSKYGTCTTASATAAKVGAVSGFTLTAGAIVTIKFSAVNTHASPTLNVNGTGAKPIYDCRTGTYPKPGALINGTHIFAYNGAQWVLLNPEDGFDLLENLDWATINSLSTAKVMSSMFAVGDCKSVILNGTCGIRTFKNEKFYPYIIGFEHNSAVEGAGRTHWLFGKNVPNGLDITFVDSMYNMYCNGKAVFCMTLDNLNNGGWNESNMKKTIIPAFKKCLPSALQSALKTVTKWTDNTGGEKTADSYVTATSETIFLLAEFEVIGEAKNANPAEKNKQKQYEYYANGNEREKYREDLLTRIVPWWSRSTAKKVSNGWCAISDSSASSSVISMSCGNSYGFAPAFCT